MRASKCTSLVHLTIVIPSYFNSYVSGSRMFATDVRNSAKFLSDGVPRSLETLDFIFNDDMRFSSIPADAYGAKSAIEELTRLLTAIKGLT